MHPALRQQSDLIDPTIKIRETIACPPQEDKARQEFRDEADVNLLLKRYGAIPNPKPVGGEWDFSTDLQGAYALLNDAKRLFQDFPQPLRSQYRNWQNVYAAIMSGEIRLKADGVLEVPSSAPAASPSDSAAVPDKT